MVFVLTTEGYVSVENPALRLHKFKAISGTEEPNPHISIDLEVGNNCFEITFMNSMDVVFSDNLQLMDDKGEYVDIDKLKFGVKLAIVRTPDHVVERLINRPEYIQLLNDLANLIISKGKLRKIDYDATYCDMIVEWSKERMESFVFSLNSIGIYIKVKKVYKSKTEVGTGVEMDMDECLSVVTADTNTLNYLDANKKIINSDLVSGLENMKAISTNNIDRDRDSDNYKIVKNVKKLNKPKMVLKTRSGVDSWEYITLCGIQCKSKNILEY